MSETMHTPADVRERVKGAWATVEAAALAQANVLDSHYGGQPAKAAEIRNAVEQVAALLRAPRGEGEDCRLAPIVRAILERIDRYQVFHDRVGPADLTLPPVARTITEEEILALRAALRSEAPGDGPVGAVCANCGAPNAAIAGGELDPDEAVCSVECYEQLRELGCPQEHGGTYRPKPARRGGKEA